MYICRLEENDVFLLLGIGKTSLYRTLFGLWTPLEGKYLATDADLMFTYEFFFSCVYLRVFFVGKVNFSYEQMATSGHYNVPRYMKLPSTPLLPAGNLTEQLLFPNLLQHYQGSKTLLALRIQKTLKKLRLTHLSHRFEGQSDISMEEWLTLSHGEKQRIGFARLFLAQDLPISSNNMLFSSLSSRTCPHAGGRSFNRFKLAFLDESSTSIDPVMERKIYQECQLQKIQLVAIEHREPLKIHYDYLLHFLPNRTATFSKINKTDLIQKMNETTIESLHQELGQEKNEELKDKFPFLSEGFRVSDRNIHLLILFLLV